MSIQSTSTATVSASSSAGSSAPAVSSSSSTTSASSSTSFKDELESVNSSSSTAQSDTSQKTSASDTSNANNSQAVQQAEVSKTNETKDAVLLQQIVDAKEQATAQNQKGNQVLSFYASEISKDVNPYDVLNTELKTINNLKNNLSTNEHGTLATNSNLGLATGLLGSISVIDEASDSGKDSKKIGLDEQDASFYLGMIDNQQMKLQIDAAASSSVAETASKNNNNYTLVQSTATGATVKVSSVLMDALADSMKNNKTVRVDFGGDVAVVMKVDKQGVLSANFIPSTAAVENYLKHNIASLKQNFDSQNLPYNDLSYSEQQKKGQNDNQRESKNKENENE